MAISRLIASRVQTFPVASRKQGSIAAPINSQLRIVPAQDDLVGRTIILITLVKEIGRVRLHEKAVRESARYPKLASVLIVKFYHHMLTERRAADPYVDCDVEH